MGSSPAGHRVLAWICVGLRGAQGLVQAPVNKIELHCALFVPSTIPLLGLTYGAAAQLLGR